MIHEVNLVSGAALAAGVVLRHLKSPVDGATNGVDLSSTCHHVACPEVLKIGYCDEIHCDNYRSDFAS
jgi:hypothetical protein